MQPHMSMLAILTRALRYRSCCKPLVVPNVLLCLPQVDELLSGIGANQQDQSIMASTTARDRYLQLTGQLLWTLHQARLPSQYQLCSIAALQQTCSLSPTNDRHERCSAVCRDIATHANGLQARRRWRRSSSRRSQRSLRHGRSTARTAPSATSPCPAAGSPTPAAAHAAIACMR